MSKAAAPAPAAKSRAISGRMPPVAVEYDANGKRATKNFEDAVEAKAFYVAKHKAGKNPTVKGELAEQVMVPDKPNAEAEKAQTDQPAVKPSSGAAADHGLQEGETLHVAYDGARGRHIRNFVAPAKARAFYRRKTRQAKNPEYVSAGSENPTTGNGSAAKEPTAASTTPECDAFGCPLGSQAAQINACIGAEPKTAAKLAEETGVGTARVKSHLKSLVEKGYVTETEQGVVLKPPAAQ